MRNGWSDEEYKTLTDLWAAGVSASQISRQMPGRSRNSVLGIVHRRGLATRAATPKPRARTTPLPFSGPKIVAKAPVESVDDPGPCDPPIDTLALRDSHCKWPYEVDRVFYYCGRAPKDGRPFCPYHCGKAYNTPPSKSAA